jgi:acetophenone carboxylase
MTRPTVPGSDPAPHVLRITEALDLDLDAERWRCNRCGTDLGPATANYKEACLLYDRDPREIHGRFPGDPEFSFSPHPDWCRIVEVCCPSCATMLDVEYLPPGHPPTHDIQLDLAKLRERLAANPERLAEGGADVEVGAPISREAAR